MTQAEKFKVGDRVRVVSALGGQQCIYPAAITGWITEVRQRAQGTVLGFCVSIPGFFACWMGCISGRCG